MSDPRDELFKKLFSRHYRRVVQFFVHRNFSSDESEDLAQQTFLRAYEKFATLRDETAGQAWIIAVAINIYRNEIRSRRALKRDAPQAPLDEIVERKLAERPAEPGFGTAPPDPRQALLDEERSRRLRKALGKLPPRMRMAVFLRIEKGLKYREIAERMNVSVDTIKAQLHQARLRLRELLADDFDGGDELEGDDE